MENMGIIYIHINSVNNKVYVGQTILSIERRKQLGYTSKFKNAINKYGWNNFESYVLEHCQIQNLDEREIYWIEKYNSVESGYNTTPGGSSGGFRSKKICPECNKKINLPSFDRHYKACIERKSCLYCNQKLSKTNHKSKNQMCSKECIRLHTGNKNLYMNNEKKCIICSQTFISKYKSRKTCSNKCLKVLISQNSKQSLKNTWRKRKSNKERQLGQFHPKAKLNENDIYKIRELYSNGDSQSDIAKLFNIDQPAVWKIINKITWKHL